MKEHPNYYAILPAPVRYSEMLSPTAKLLYAEITALAQKEGFCWATNGYFARLFYVHKKYVSQLLQELEHEKAVKIDINKEGGNKRKIYPNIAYLKDFKTPPIQLQLDRGIPLQLDRYPTKPGYPIQQNLDSNIEQYKINNKKKKGENITHPPFVIITKEEEERLIVDYGKSEVNKYIESLNIYAAQKPKAFKIYGSHSATIRSWMRKDGIKKIEKPKDIQKLPEQKRFDPAVSQLIKETAQAIGGRQ